MQEMLQQILDWIAAQGIWAPILFIVVYAAAGVAFIPGSILTLSAGALFGVVAQKALSGKLETPSSPP